jgi:hypothetical protein
MKIEMDEQTSWTVSICLIALILATAALGGCNLCEKTKQDAIKAGLVEKPNIGSDGTHWDKP